MGAALEPIKDITTYDLLIRFVADYLAGVGNGTDEDFSGSVLIDPCVGPCLRLGFDAKRCRVESGSEPGADCHIRMPWTRLVQLLETELHPQEALKLELVEVCGDRRLAEHALMWLHDSDFAWHVFEHLPVWQLQINLRGMSLNEIRAFAHEAYEVHLSPNVSKSEAIAKMVEVIRFGPRLSDAIRQSVPGPVRRSAIRFDAGRLRAEFETLRSRFPANEKSCSGCEPGGDCRFGDYCGRKEFGWTLQSFGDDHRQAVFGGPLGVIESQAVVKTDACFGIFEEIVDSIPGACRARVKVYRPGYRFGHLPHTDACDLVRSIIPIVAGGDAALSVEPSLGAFERDGLLDSHDLDEPGRLYWFPSWFMHSGRNRSAGGERVFLLVSQRFDDETRRLQCGSTTLASRT